jgi:hypothetical protein
MNCSSAVNTSQRKHGHGQAFREVRFKQQIVATKKTLECIPSITAAETGARRGVVCRETTRYAGSTPLETWVFSIDPVLTAAYGAEVD